VQHLSAVHQRVFRLQQVGQAVELLEPGIGVMLAVRGMTGNLDRDDVLGHVVPVVRAERHPGDPGAQESAPCLVLAPARQLALGKQALVLCACPARTWMTMTSSSLMTLLPSSDRAFQSQVATRDGTQNTLIWIDARLMGFTSPPPIAAVHVRHATHKATTQRDVRAASLRCTGRRRASAGKAAR